jgi:hypothetical protein
MSTQSYDYSVDVRRIEEFKVDGKRLGRHVRHDSRAWDHRHQRSCVPLQTTLIPRYIAILDQNGYGACTGNADTGALGSGSLFAAFSKAFPNLVLNELFAQGMYSAAETLDGDGPFPPNDNGSTGPSVAQATLNLGYIDSYTHCFSPTDVLDALSSGKTVMIGSNWYDSMDRPDSNGLVTISPNAAIRGGHEYLARGLDVDNRLVNLDNSWGTSYGINGSFSYSWDTLTRLLSETGDGTILNPLVS